VALYFYLAFVREMTLGKARWGLVLDEKENPQVFAQVKLVDIENGETAIRTISDEKGRYFMVARRGEYNLEAIKSGEETSKIFKTSQKIFIPKRKSVKEKLKLKK